MEPEQRSPLEVLRVFLKLGLTGFGGPMAHLGYFRNAFVVERRWLDERAFADLVAPAQFPSLTTTPVRILLFQAFAK
jgi:chromate transporter